MNFAPARPSRSIEACVEILRMREHACIGCDVTPVCYVLLVFRGLSVRVDVLSTRARVSVVCQAGGEFAHLRCLRPTAT